MPYFSAIVLFGHGMILAFCFIMPRRPLIRSTIVPYHVIARTNNQEWFPLEITVCWKIFEFYLNIVSMKYGAKIGSFVLMSNHFHMIIWTPSENLDQIMHYLLREVSKKINEKANRINHVFGGPYKWTLIDNEKYLGNVYKYIYQNPVRSGLTQKIEQYPFSTAYYLFKKFDLAFTLQHEQICEFAGMDQEIHHQLTWLNEIYTKKQNEVIRLSLKRSVFIYPKHSKYHYSIKNLIIQIR